MTRKTIEGAGTFINFPGRSSVISVIGAKNNVVGVYFAFNIYADSDKYSFNLLGGAYSTVVSSTPRIHSLFLFPT
jgi:hypothetical protein